jgi:hypothetical protein
MKIISADCDKPYDHVTASYAVKKFYPREIDKTINLVQNIKES